MDKKRPNVEVKYIALPLSIFKNSNVFVKREQRKLACSAERRKGRMKSHVFVKREQRKLACSAERRADERANGKSSLLELF